MKSFLKTFLDDYEDGILLFGTPSLEERPFHCYVGITLFITHASSFHSSSHPKKFPLCVQCGLLIPQVILSICLDTAQIVYVHVCDGIDHHFISLLAKINAFGSQKACGKNRIGPALWRLGERQCRVAANGDAAAAAPRTIKFPFRRSSPDFGRDSASPPSPLPPSPLPPSQAKVWKQQFCVCFVFTWKQFLWHVKNLF